MHPRRPGAGIADLSTQSYHTVFDLNANFGGVYSRLSGEFG
jgi:hypothetical protein